MATRESLGEFDTMREQFWGPMQWRGRALNREHMPLDLFRQVFPKVFALFREYFVFVVVRNPYTRVVSAFNQMNQQSIDLARSGEPEKVAQYRETLNAFVAGLKEPTIDSYSIMTRHYVRQRDVIYSGDKCLADLIMRQEAWDASLAKLAVFRPAAAAAIGAHRRLNVRAIPGSKQSYLEPASIARINAFYADDFKLFDYPVIEAG